MDRSAAGWNRSAQRPAGDGGGLRFGAGAAGGRCARHPVGDRRSRPQSEGRCRARPVRPPPGWAASGDRSAKIMPRPDIGPALAELRLTGDRVELVRTIPIRGASGRAISGLPGPGSAHAVTEPALDLAGDLLPPDPSGAEQRVSSRWPRAGSSSATNMAPRCSASTRPARCWSVGYRPGARGISPAPIIPCVPCFRDCRHPPPRSRVRGLGVSPGGKQFHLVFQSPLAHPDESAHRSARHVRILTLDADTGVLQAQYLYPFDPPAKLRP